MSHHGTQQTIAIRMRYGGNTLAMQIGDVSTTNRMRSEAISGPSSNAQQIHVLHVGHSLFISSSFISLLSRTRRSTAFISLRQHEKRRVTDGRLP
jgi:hypothetical protein